MNKDMGRRSFIKLAGGAFGISALSYDRISYTTKEKIVDIGPIQATAEREKSIPVPPLLGGLVLVAGIGLVAVGYKK